MYKQTSLRINEEYLKKLKKLAIDKNTTITDLLNKYIENGLINDGIEL